MKYYFIFCLHGCGATVGPYTDIETAKADVLTHNALHGHDAECREAHSKWEPHDEIIIEESGTVEGLLQEAREFEGNHIYQMAFRK